MFEVQPVQPFQDPVDYKGQEVYYLQDYQVKIKRKITEKKKTLADHRWFKIWSIQQGLAEYQSIYGHFHKREVDLTIENS